MQAYIVEILDTQPTNVLLSNVLYTLDSRYLYTFEHLLIIIETYFKIDGTFEILHSTINFRQAVHHCRFFFLNIKSTDLIILL